jgi:hypothetical protein
MLPLLHPALFDEPLQRAALDALVASGGNLHDAVESADPLVGELLSRLAVEETPADPVDIRRFLLRDLGARVLADLQRDLNGWTGDFRSDDYRLIVEQHAWLKHRLESIGPDAPPDPIGEDELLAWLAERGEGSA